MRDRLRGEERKGGGRESKMNSKTDKEQDGTEIEKK